MNSFFPYLNGPTIYVCNKSQMKFNHLQDYLQTFMLGTLLYIINISFFELEDKTLSQETISLA